MTEAPRIEAEGRHREAAAAYWGTLPGMSDDPEGELAEAFRTFEAAHLARLDAVARERDRLSDQVEKLRHEPWPAWAKQIADMLIEYGMIYEPEDGVDLGQSVADWLSDFDPADHKRALLAEQRLAIAEEALGRIVEATKYVDGYAKDANNIGRLTLAKLKDTSANG